MRGPPLRKACAAVCYVIKVAIAVTLIVMAFVAYWVGVVVRRVIR